MDRGAWWVMVHGIAKSWIRLSTYVTRDACIHEADLATKSKVRINKASSLNFLFFFLWKKRWKEATSDSTEVIIKPSPVGHHMLEGELAHLLSLSKMGKILSGMLPVFDLNTKHSLSLICL